MKTGEEGDVTRVRDVARVELGARDYSTKTYMDGYNAVSVRVFQLRCALEHQPEAPAEQVGTKQEIQVIRKLTKHKGKRLSVRDFVRGVAKLGGFLGRKGDGDPGVRALWRGYQRLQDMLQGFQLLTDSNFG